MMVEKIILDDIKPQMVDFLFELVQKQTRKMQELLSYFRNTQSDLSASILTWLQCSDVYYRMLSSYAGFLKNEFMFQRLITKTKESEVIYFEKNLLANAILDTKDYFIQAAQRLSADPVLVEFPRHGLSFFNEKLERELKKSITTYESVKADLDLRKFAGITIESILNTTFTLQEDDKIEQKLMEEAGIQGKNI
jgi:hypothetical protein